MKRIGAFLALLVLACSSTALAESSKMRVTLALVDLYDDDVTVLVDGRELWSGKVTVAKENESTGLSLAKEVEVPTCSEVVVRSKRFTDHKRVCLTNKMKVIAIWGGRVEPHISVEERLQLD